MPQRIVIIDDDEAVGYSLVRMFQSRDREILTFTDPHLGLDKLKQLQPQVVLLDIKMPGVDGLEVLEQIRRQNPLQLVIMMTAHGTIDSVVTAMKHGAFDYLVKPFEVEELKSTVERALEAARLQRHVSPAATSGASSASGSTGVKETMLGHSAAMQRVFKAIAQIAPRDVPVLIRGESGTGKELVARAVWSHSKRAQKPFLAVNCAALPENLLETELFGHEKGAFTGAHERRLGKFELADRGTLFLDEVGDMSLAMQAKILRVVQEGTFERVGGTKTLKANVRILAATNIDLEKAIGFRRFREDLYYRLRVFEILLPPLRERSDDIPGLANYFLHRFRTELDCPALSISWDALDLLKSAEWPGNVRELENIMRRAMVVTRSPCILAADLEPILQESSRRRMVEAHPTNSGMEPSTGTTPVAEAPGTESAATENTTPAAAATETPLERLAEQALQAHTGDVLNVVERQLIQKALEKEGWNIQRAARLLGVARTTLRSRISRHKIKKHLKAR